MQIKYLSHACFELKNSKTLLIDPFFHGNELAPSYAGSPDLILVTHEHFDHFDPEFLSQVDVPVVCPSTCNPKKAVIMKIGDKKTVEGIFIEMVSASHHQSDYAAGFIFEFEGKRIYHPGDTYLDGVKEQKDIDIFFVPIGGFYTMNVDEALKALKIVNPELAIPMHFNTFDQIKADPQEFKQKAEKKGFTVKVIPIGGSIEVL